MFYLFEIKQTWLLFLLSQLLFLILTLVRMCRARGPSTPLHRSMDAACLLEKKTRGRGENLAYFHESWKIKGESNLTTYICII